MEEQLKALEQEMLTSPAQTTAKLAMLLPEVQANADFANEAYLLCLLGGCAFFQGDLEDTVTYAQQTLVIAQAHQLSSLAARAHNALALVYWRTGHLSETLEHLRHSLELVGELQDTVGIIRATNNLAAVYADLQDYKHALIHYRESARLGHQIGRSEYVADALLGIVDIRVQQGQYPQALALVYKVKTITQDFSRFHATVLGFEALLLRHLGKWNEGLHVGLQGMELARSVADIESQAFLSGILAELYMAQGELDAAQHYFTTGQQLTATPSRQQVLQMRLLRSQAELYEIRGQYQAAYQALLQHIRMKDEHDAWGRQVHSEFLSKQIQVEVLQRAARNERERNNTLQQVNEQLLMTQAQLSYQANHDPLTGLLNRAAFWRQTWEALEHLNQESYAGIIFADIDYLKQVNDTYGHAIGDRMIQEIVKRFQKALQPHDLLGRLSGDEFMMYLPGLTSPADLPQSIERLFNALRPPLQLDDITIHPTVSFGVVIAPLDGTDLTTLHHHADLALYQAKLQGKNTWVRFEAAISAAELRRRRLSEALHTALDGQLELHYQPQFTLPQRELKGVEALIRWHHPELGWISPAEFIPLAEESRLIFDLGRWVLNEACRQASAWDFETRQLAMSVNVSVKQFERADFVQLVSDILNQHGLSGKCLVLELTETVLHKEAHRSIKTVEALHALGVKIAIDDFGTGYSSLRLLKELPFRQLKIDRSFVNDLTAQDSTVTSARHFMEVMLNLAHGLGMRVVAEGIETQEQFELLSELGCDKAQGYWLARPLPAAVLFEQFLKR